MYTSMQPPTQSIYRFLSLQKILLCPFLLNPPHLLPQSNTDLILIMLVLPILAFHINGLILYIYLASHTTCVVKISIFHDIEAFEYKYIWSFFPLDLFPKNQVHFAANALLRKPGPPNLACCQKLFIGFKSSKNFFSPFLSKIWSKFSLVSQKSYLQ